ncbi:MAG: PTS glucose transporter subunit IIA [Traorella sp.]
MKMFDFFSNKQWIYAVTDDICFPLKEVNDDIFSKKVLGDGITIAPTSNIVYSPCDGILTTLFPTGHAFGITRDDGLEILVHIGIDSVMMKGKGFKVFKKQG